MLFFKFCLVYFLLFTRALFNWRAQSRCIPLGVFEWSRIMFLFFFFRLKSSNGFHVETHIFGRSFIFCLCLLLWGFEFAPARGSPASVIDHVNTSQDYIKFEHVRTWLLSSSFAKLQQFWSDCCFFKFCLVYILLFTRAMFNWWL